MNNEHNYLNMRYTILFFFSVSLLWACSASSSHDNGTSDGDSTNAVEIVHMSPQDFQSKMNELDNEQLIDVRTQGEVDGGFIANMTHMDYNGDGFGNQIQGLDKNRPVMVYCAGGGRSKKAANNMKTWGFTEIYELDNGFNGWESAGLPVEK